MRKKLLATVLCAASVLAPTHAFAWGAEGHRLIMRRAIELLPPEMKFVDALDRVIYDELMVGKATRQAERELKTIVVELQRAGAQAIVLGCTELEMVVDVDANVLPIYDCTRIHAEAAVEWILGG